jgi:hypothetical protein
VHRERVTYRIAEHDPRNVMFLQLELNRLVVMPPRRAELPRAYSAR